MWIIPKPLHISACALDTEALISDYQELSELCEPSLLVRSKPMPQKTWLRRWKRAGSMPHLSGRILKPSLGDSFATRWTSCQAASLVSHLAPQADEQETTTRATFGRTSSKASNSWADLPLFSSRMLRGSSAQSSRAMDGPTLLARPFCSMSSENWSAWVTKRRREYSQRVKSVRPISENECSLWVCAPISATQDALLFQRCSAPQSEEMWLTPATTAGTAKEPLYTAQGEPWRGEGRAYRANGMHRTLTLNMQVDAQPQSEKMWGTARVGASNAPAGGGDPSKKEHKYRLENQVQPTQPQEVQMWGTPRANKIRAENLETLKARARRHGRTSFSDLPTQVLQPTPPQEAQNSTSGSPQGSQWATPYAGTKDHQGGSLEHYQSRPFASRQIDLHGQITMINEAYTGKLNPRWVETLMGLPVGWTMPSCVTPWTTEWTSCDCSEMESCQRQQSEPSESCGENWSIPPASQRGETLEVYFRKSIDRMKQGGVRFAPTLQVAVEAEERGIDIAKSLSLITPHLDQDTEDLVQMAMQGES